MLHYTMLRFVGYDIHHLPGARDVPLGREVPWPMPKSREQLSPYKPPLPPFHQG